MLRPVERLMKEAADVEAEHAMWLMEKLDAEPDRNESRSYWSDFNQPTPDYQEFKRYSDEIDAFCFADGDHLDLQPISSALEQFRLGARASRDGGNTMSE